MNDEGSEGILSRERMDDMLEYEYGTGQLMVRLSGELDDHAVNALRPAMDQLIDTHRPRQLILDVQDLTFMDSSGVGMIFGRYKRMRRIGGSVAVKGVDARMDRIFQISGVYHVIARLDAGEEGA